VRKPGRDKAAYELALAQAEAAYRLKPDPEILNTLGVAQYRAGKFQQALETLEKSRKLNPQGADTSADVAFLAMAQYRAGQVADARKNLNKLRETAKEMADDVEALGFLHEAETLIETVAGAK